jgi:hypothetical protein
MAVFVNIETTEKQNGYRCTPLFFNSAKLIEKGLALEF